MAHFAQVNEDNIVTQVIVVTNEDAPDEATGQTFIASIGLSGEWLQTSYNTWGNAHSLGGTPLRKNYAGIGFTYDKDRDAFIPPKLFNSWILNADTCLWEAPTPMPKDDKVYTWDESTLSWKELSA
jgi:hypothetical protein